MEKTLKEAFRECLPKSEDLFIDGMHAYFHALCVLAGEQKVVEMLTAMEEGRQAAKH